MRKNLVRRGSAIAVATIAIGATTAASAQSIGWLSYEGGSIFFPESNPVGNSVTQTATGKYTVTFAGLGNSFNSNVQVNAVTALSLTPHYCITAGWYSTNGADTDVDVDCFDANGNPFNGDFAVFYQARTSAPSSGGIAFLWGNQPTTTDYTPSSLYSFNSTGGVNTVHRENTGLYFAFLPGFTRNGGNPQVTAYGGVAARCEIVDWYHNRAGANVVVQCVNAAGTPTDEYFSLSFSYGVDEATSASTHYGGYAWANNATAVSYTPLVPYQWQNTSATRKIKAMNSGSTTFLDLPIDESVLLSSHQAMVTAIGSKGEYCDRGELGYFGSAKRETLTMFINCFNAQGQPITDESTGQFLASP